MKKILIRIEKKTGKVTITPQGYTGSECLEATAALEKGLEINSGAQREHTADFYQQQEDQQLKNET